MNPNLKNALVVIGGVVIGAVVNVLLLQGNGTIIALPEGADVSTVEALKSTIHLFKPVHFIFPFLAHAGGTLVGAFVASKFSADKHLLMSMVVGVFFLIGGIMNVATLPAPTWFSATDIILAYLPMAYLGYKLSGRT